MHADFENVYCSGEQRTSAATWDQPTGGRYNKRELRLGQKILQIDHQILVGL